MKREFFAIVSIAAFNTLQSRPRRVSNSLIHASRVCTTSRHLGTLQHVDIFWFFNLVRSPIHANDNLIWSGELAVWVLPKAVFFVLFIPSASYKIRCIELLIDQSSSALVCMRSQWWAKLAKVFSANCSKPEFTRHDSWREPSARNGDLGSIMQLTSGISAFCGFVCTGYRLPFL